MWPFKGGDGWGFFNSSNLKFQLIFNSGQPMFKVKFSNKFSTKSTKFYMWLLGESGATNFGSGEFTHLGAYNLGSVWFVLVRWGCALGSLWFALGSLKKLKRWGFLKVWEILVRFGSLLVRWGCALGSLWFALGSLPFRSGFALNSHFIVNINIMPSGFCVVLHGGAQKACQHIHKQKKSGKNDRDPNFANILTNQQVAQFQNFACSARARAWYLARWISDELWPGNLNAAGRTYMQRVELTCNGPTKGWEGGSIYWLIA